MTVEEILAELAAKGSETTRRIFRRHGAPEPLDGVKVADLKQILKRTRADHPLALALWDTGHSDARYLAGLMAVPRQMTPEVLQAWAEGATWSMLAEYAVAWVAAESGHGWALARRWIDDPREHVADAGWATLGYLCALTADADLDLAALDALLTRVETTLPGERNRVRYAMNGFVIAVGTWVAPLHDRAIAVARALGVVEVDVGDTSCTVPDAAAAIAKAHARGPVKKRKTVRC